MSNLGTFYVVATPIGHLKDMSFRAIEVLQAVDCVYAEDTRHSKPLLQHYQIHTPLRSLHEHNEEQRLAQILQQLQQGENLALISDAGTPLISDPGFAVVRHLRQHGIVVMPVPGACALIAALSVSGLATDKFLFEGFLPAKSIARQKVLMANKEQTRTVIYYESSHRILSTLEDCLAVLGTNRKIVLARELTKTFETLLSGTAAEVLDRLKQDPQQQKGEFVLLIAADPQPTSSISEQGQRLLTELLKELPLNQAAKITARVTGDKKNQLYDFGLSLT